MATCSLGRTLNDTELGSCCYDMDQRKRRRCRSLYFLEAEEVWLDRVRNKFGRGLFSYILNGVRPRKLEQGCGVDWNNGTGAWRPTSMANPAPKKPVSHLFSTAHLSPREPGLRNENSVSEDFAESIPDGGLQFQGVKILRDPSLRNSL